MKIFSRQTSSEVGSTGSKQKHFRRLFLESLESRKLLTADLGMSPLPVVESSSIGILGDHAHDHSGSHDHGHSHGGKLDQLGLLQYIPPSIELNELYGQFAESSFAALTGSDRLSQLGIGTSDFIETSSHVSSISGVRHAYFQQVLNGMDVVGAQVNLSTDENGVVVSAFSSAVKPQIAEGKANAILPSWTAVDAIEALASEFEWTLDVNAITPVEAATSDGSFLFSAPEIADESIKADQVYVPDSGGFVELAWRLNFNRVATHNQWFEVTVGDTGEVLTATNFGAHATYTAFEFPKESPLDGPRTNIVDPHRNPLGWHDFNGSPGADSTLTLGNNVHVYADTDANNLPDPNTSPNGGANLTFSFPFNGSNNPTLYGDAIATNLFYANNAIHDILNENGFDEAAGNFQFLNYSGQGQGSDEVFAEYFDGSGTNNANFFTPPDGQNPRMQMFLFTNTNPARPSSLDNGIVIHEYGHGLSNRLTGGAANTTALQATQARGMGEGWSDILALLLTQQQGDSPNVATPIGSYATGNPNGIRSQPYSYNMQINSLTLADIATQSQPHGVGEVLATTLWDLNWALIRGKNLDPVFDNEPLGFSPNLYTGNGGNNMALRLIIEGMKLQPANPTFLQTRDAILEADRIMNGGLYQDTIWKVFARRGMGVSATSGASTSTTVSEAFDVPLTKIEFPRQAPTGGMVSHVEGSAPQAASATGNVVIPFKGERDIEVAFTLTPESPTAILIARIERADGLVVHANKSAPAPGEPVTIRPTALPSIGNYRLIVSTSSGSTFFHVEAARNASLESELGDTSTNRELNINPSYNFTAGSRLAVIGSTDLSVKKYNDLSKFQDVAPTGPLNLTDDGEITVTSSIGNELFPAGQWTIGNNGGVIFGANLSLSAGNSSLSQVSFAGPALLPFWDDIDSDTGNVYAVQTTVDGEQAVVIQWDNRPHYPNVGSATFQLQIFGSGPVLARFVYEDVFFGNAAYDKGASATVGYWSEDVVLEQSFNQPDLSNGDVIEFTYDDIDEYEFTAVAGQRVDVVARGINGSRVQDSVVRLFSPSGAQLAQATNRPIDNANRVANYDKGIASYLIPSDGTYSVRLIGKEKLENYVILVTRDSVMDTENTTGLNSPFRRMDIGRSFGFLNAQDTRDVYGVRLESGETYRISLERPFNNPNYVPLNFLETRLNLRSPNGSLVAFDTTFNSADRLVVNYTATQTGIYRVDIPRISGTGEYVATVNQTSSSASAFSDSSIDDTLQVPLLDENEDITYLIDETLRHSITVTEDTAEGETIATGSNAIVDGRTLVLRSVPSPILADEKNLPEGVALAWDLDGDGVYDDARGAVVTVAASFFERGSNDVFVLAQLGNRFYEQKHEVVVAHWHNVESSFDVDGNGALTPLDALIVVNEINRRSTSGSTFELPILIQEKTTSSYVDTNGDNMLTPLDALRVINALNAADSPEVGAEAVSAVDEVLATSALYEDWSEHDLEPKHSGGCLCPTCCAVASHR